MVYNELRKVAPPPEVHSSDDWSLVDETWINERAKELIGPRPGNILWRLVAIYSPGAVGSVAGAIGEVSEAESMAGTIRGVNPTGSRVNCVNCAISADYTLAGNPTVAGPEGPYSYLQLANWMGSRFVAVTGEMQVADMLIGSGEGAQGIGVRRVVGRGERSCMECRESRRHHPLLGFPGHSRWSEQRCHWCK
jgi:hypothetical protein